MWLHRVDLPFDPLVYTVLRELELDSEGLCCAGPNPPLEPLYEAS